jgi:hypothetical protein
MLPSGSNPFEARSRETRAFIEETHNHRALANRSFAHSLS